MSTGWSGWIALSGAIALAGALSACGSANAERAGGTGGVAGTDAGVDGVASGGGAGTAGTGGVAGGSAVCTPGATQCVKNTPETCDASGSWRDGAPCAYVCQNGSCGGTCTPGSKQCNGNVPQTCGTNGAWQSGAACPNQCSAGTCTGSCTPGAKQCNGNTVQTCGTNGSWQDTTTCQYVCSAAACAGVCAPGATRCSGATPQTCSAKGQWVSGTACQYVCSGGSCSGSTGSVIASSRKVDWSKSGVKGGIPSRTTICATLSPGASASQINQAIASCPAGQVVYLAAGTYNLSSGIDFASHSNVTLRGAGANETFLIFSGSVSCHGLGGDICIEGSDNWSGGPANTANWTGGYSAGTTQITLSSTNNLTAGNMLILDQTNDSSDTGSIYVCNTANVCSQEGSGGAGRSGRTQEQIVQVQSINGSTVTIAPGLYMPNWRSSQSPGAWWGDVNIRSAGIEDMSLDHRGSSAKGGVIFYSAINCWAKGIRSLGPNRDHVWLNEAAHVTVADSYFYGTQNATSQSYGVESYMGSDNLIENNVFQHVTGPIQTNGAGSGNVWAYNFSTDDYYVTSPSWMMQSVWIHGGGASMELWEGNVGAGLMSDDIHGTHNFETVFRNYWNGWESGKSNSTVPVSLMAFSRYYNVVGNVLGKAGYHTNYQDVAPNGSSYATSIYALGWSGSGSTSSSVPDDPNVVNTLMRWGNYDAATGQVHWDSREVPSGLSQYANSVPSSHSLPASLFLGARPSFWTTPWGTPAWPAIGPDVAGGSGPGGHSYDIPAKLCYDHTAKDSSGILKFNAASCYGG